MPEASSPSKTGNTRTATGLLSVDGSWYTGNEGAETDPSSRTGRVSDQAQRPSSSEARTRMPPPALVDNEQRFSADVRGVGSGMEEGWDYGPQPCGDGFGRMAQPAYPGRTSHAGNNSILSSHYQVDPHTILSRHLEPHPGNLSINEPDYGVSSGQPKWTPDSSNYFPGCSDHFLNSNPRSDPWSTYQTQTKPIRHEPKSLYPQSGVDTRTECDMAYDIPQGNPLFEHIPDLATGVLASMGTIPSTARMFQNGTTASNVAFRGRIPNGVPDQPPTGISAINHPDPGHHRSSMHPSDGAPGSDMAEVGRSRQSEPPSTSVPRRTTKFSLPDPLDCDVCRRRFRGVHRQGSLTRHRNTTHGGSGNEARDFPCRKRDCGKTFKRSDARTKHERTHGDLGRAGPARRPYLMKKH